MGSFIGRPPLYETAEELGLAVDNYFESLQAVDKDGNDLPGKAPTVAGLALFLGFESRQSIYDMKGRGKDFSYILRKALLAIEAVHEQSLSSGRYAVGSIFWLKNHQWRDQQEVAHSGAVTIIDDVPRKSAE